MTKSVSLKLQWALIEDENRIVHILPVTPVTGFETRQQAVDFLDRMEALGKPVITADDDTITHTYVGHILSPACPCCPTSGESDPGLLTHYLFN